MSYTKTGMQVTKGKQSIAQVGVACQDPKNHNNNNEKSDNKDELIRWIIDILKSLVDQDLIEQCLHKLV